MCWCFLRPKCLSCSSWHRRFHTTNSSAALHKENTDGWRFHSISNLLFSFSHLIHWKTAQTMSQAHAGHTAGIATKSLTITVGALLLPMAHGGVTKSRCKLLGYPLPQIFWRKKPKPFETETPRTAIFSSGFQQEQPSAFQHEDLSHQLNHLFHRITQSQDSLDQRD